MAGLGLDVPTDPFMMLATPVDHYVNKSGVATANFFFEFGGIKVRQFI